MASDTSPEDGIEVSPYSGRLRKSEWSVRKVPMRAASEFIREHHYAHGHSNTATYLHGLFDRDQRLCGVAWWIPPTKSAALATCGDHPWTGVLALSRLACAPECPKNAATFLIGRSIRLIDRIRWPVLVTYADEWRGHTGHIYRASGWTYGGKTRPERTYVLGDRLIARKAGPRTRTHAEMLAMGARLVGSFAKHKYTKRT